MYCIAVCTVNASVSVSVLTFAPLSDWRSVPEITFDRM